MSWHRSTVTLVQEMHHRRMYGASYAIKALVTPNGNRHTINNRTTHACCQQAKCNESSASMPSTTVRSRLCHQHSGNIQSVQLIPSTIVGAGHTLKAHRSWVTMMQCSVYVCVVILSTHGRCPFGFFGYVSQVQVLMLIHTLNLASFKGTNSSFRWSHVIIYLI